MLERVVKEKLPAENWGDSNSGNFWGMIGNCAPPGVIEAVVKDLGCQESAEYLYKELMEFYDKG